MYCDRFLAVVLLSVQGYGGWRHAFCQNQLPADFTAFWLNSQEQHPPGLGTSVAEQHSRRSRREVRTVNILSTATNSALPPDFFASTVNSNAANTFVTPVLTIHLNHTEELSVLLESLRSSHISNAAAVSTPVYDGHTTENKPPHTGVKWMNVSVTKNSYVEESHAPIIASDKPLDRANTSRTNATGTNNWNCQINATFTTTNETHVSMASTITRAIRQFVKPITAIVGVVGNTISILVMFQRNNRNTSLGIYLGILAVSDTLVLCVSTAYWSLYVSSTPLRDIDCQIRGWLSNSLQMFGFCIILGLTSDRLIAVRFPLKAAVWCVAKRAKLICGSTFGVVWLLNAPFAVYNHVESCNICSMGTPGSVVSFVYPWVSVCVGLVIPFVLLVSMNVAIAMGIRNRLQYSKYIPSIKRDNSETMEMRGYQAYSSQERQQNSSRNNLMIIPMSLKDRNAIVTLFLISFTFLVLVTPHFVHIAIYSMTSQATTASQQVNYKLFFQISRLLYSMNHACNFFLYCISGAKFRNEVVRLFRPKTCN